MGLIEILWTVTGIVVPLLLGTAWAMVGLAPPEFWIARGCVGLAAFIFGAAALTWLSTSEWPNTARIFARALLGAAALAGFSEAIRWINVRENLIVSQAAAAIDKRAEIRNQLQQFYIDGGVLIDADLPRDISEENFKAYESDVNKWANDTANWIGEHLGPAAKAKFLDRSSMPSMSYGRTVNASHNNIINAITAFRKNLSTLIETSAWDKQ